MIGAVRSRIKRVILGIWLDEGDCVKERVDGGTHVGLIGERLTEGDAVL